MKDVEHSQVSRERGKILPPLLDYLPGDIRLSFEDSLLSFIIISGGHCIWDEYAIACMVKEIYLDKFEINCGY